MEIKVPFYDIVVRLFNGVLFVVICCLLFRDWALDILNAHKVMKGVCCLPDIVVVMVMIAVAYEIGHMIDRLGSCPEESVFKRYQLIPFNDNYVLYNKAKKDFTVISILQQEYAKCRTEFTLFLIGCLVAIFSFQWKFAIIFATFAVVYYLSWRKFASKIVKLMEAKQHE